VDTNIVKVIVIVIIIGVNGPLVYVLLSPLVVQTHFYLMMFIQSDITGPCRKMTDFSMVTYAGLL